MKIGILTFHCASNYGAVLQAFSLQSFLEALGHTVSIIDYRPEYLLAPYKVFKFTNSVPALVAQSALWPLRLSRLKGFNRFSEQHLHLTKESYSTGAFAENFDAYILGSDQIWNSKITRGDPVFLGKFIRPATSKLIAYSASTEVDSEGASVDLSAYRKSLREFSSISVREQALQDPVQALVETDVRTTLDPTLLISPEQFLQVASPIRTTGHVVVYQVKKDTKTLVVARELASRFGIRKKLEFVNSVGAFSALNRHAAASPQEFVGAFASAALVVTTSFHGTIFAIIFRKPFVCIMDKSRGNYRISNLLTMLGLERQMIYSSDHVPTEPIDYDAVYERLKHLQDASREFLLSSLA